jgi:hypothetical protein
MFTGGTIGTNFDALTFAAPNPAGVAANLFYYLRHDAAGNSYFGYIDPNAGTAATAATDLFNFSKRINYMTFSAVTGIGYGPTNLFYYLRYDTNGNTVFGTIDVDPAFTGTDDERAVDQFTLTNHFQELEFIPTDVGYGATLFYSITGGYTTTNIVTTYQTNIVTTYQTNTVTTYTTNCVVSFTTTNTVTATGMDICQSRIVTAAADCLGPIAPLVLVIGTPTINPANGFLVYSLSFPTETGKSYTVQYTDSLTNPTWTDLPGMPVLGTGGIVTITDPTTPPHQPTRFYRIKTP